MVRLQVEGAEILAIDGATLRLAAQDEPLEIALPKAPFAYQANGVSPQGEALALDVRPSVDAPRQAAAPDDDPEDLIYSTFLGGSGDERGGYDLALDATGRAIVTGWTWSSDFPTTPGAFDPSLNGDVDAFVVRLNASGNALDYATFLGGSSSDFAYAVALSTAGRTTVMGWTTSSDFPTTAGAFDSTYNGGADAFVVRLNAAGSALDYATFLGGSGDDYGGITLALDATGRATVTGAPAPATSPPRPALSTQATTAVTSDAFVARLNAAGSALDYATYLGGSGSDGGYALALDAAGRATVTGETASSDFPTTPGAFDTSYNGGYPYGDAFVVRINAAGSALDYATFLGGSSSDGGYDLALDAAGRATVTGYTDSSDFPTTPGAFDPSFNGYKDAFVVRLDAAGRTLDYATFLGGSDFDSGVDLALDAAGRVAVTGATSSSDFPTIPGAFDPTYHGGYDAFVVRLNAAGSALDYGTFLGGSYNDQGYALALDPAGRATVMGWTASSDFPTTPGAFDTSHNGGKDAFVARLSMAPTAPSVAAPWTDQPPTVDGNLGDWGQWSPLVLNRDTAFYVATQPPGSPPPTPADNSAELHALWTGTNLYFAIFVRDDAIVNDSTDVWRDDEIELAFVGAWDGNPAGGDTHQYTVNADGRITDFGQAIPPIQAAAVPVTGGWNVEVRIPATHLFGLNAPLTAGKTMAFDLGLHDDDDGGNWDSHMIWAGDSTCYHAGGLLRLDDVVAPTPLPTSTPTATHTATPTSTPTRTATPTATRHVDRNPTRPTSADGLYANRHADGHANRDASSCAIATCR